MLEVVDGCCRLAQGDHRARVRRMPPHVEKIQPLQSRVMADFNCNDNDRSSLCRTNERSGKLFRVSNKLMFLNL